MLKIRSENGGPPAESRIDFEDGHARPETPETQRLERVAPRVSLRIEPPVAFDRPVERALDGTGSVVAPAARQQGRCAQERSKTPACPVQHVRSPSTRAGAARTRSCDLRKPLLKQV